MVNELKINTEDPEQSKAPLENRSFTVDVDGIRKQIPALDKIWVDKINRKFSRYVAHPIPTNGKFILGEKETWLDVTRYVVQDLEWLLQQRHHIFWSHMIYSKDAHQLLITFLQEAPPYYLRDEFPKDDEMQELFSNVEYLVFIVLVRLSTERESENNYINNLGKLLYENYIFTVPIFLDICLVYGIQNRDSVSKMFNDVLSVAPQYLEDFKELVPHFIHVLSNVKNKFETNEISSMNDKSKLREVRDLILHLYDSCANIQIFLDIQSASSLFRPESFLGEVSSFYSYVIPKIYKFVKRSSCSFPNGFNCLKKIDEIRLNMLLIVRNAFCDIINDILNNEEKRGDYVNEFLTKIMEIFQGTIFVVDYNEIYPIDADLKMLSDLSPDIDSENFKYITQAVSSLKEKPNARKPLTGVYLDSLITEVKDILPHLDEGTIKNYLEFYDFDTEKALAAILENRGLPERRPQEKQAPVKPKKNATAYEKTPKNEETFDLLNDKTDMSFLRDKISNLVMADEYGEEYDDTYDDNQISIREVNTPDQDRRPFVTPMALRQRKEGDEGEEEEEEDDDEEEGYEEEEERQIRARDCFVPNPAEIRARQEQRRIERANRDYVGRRKGQGQDKQVLINRDRKDTHKAFIGNHNRRKLASKKRNIPINS